MPMGGLELLIILIIILLFFGAKQIPELARSLGKGTREFRKGVSEDPDRGGEDGARLQDGDREQNSLSRPMSRGGASRAGADVSKIGQEDL